MAIQFVYTYSLKQYIKEFPGVYWSSKKRCFYLFYLETRIEAFKQYMLAGGYTVSIYQIENVQRRSKGVKIIQKGLSFEKTEVHRQFIDFLGGRRYRKTPLQFTADSFWISYVILAIQILQSWAQKT